jgi:hypothetical protein
MHRGRTIAVLALAVSGLLLGACAESASEEAPETHLAAKVKEIKGSNLKQVILSSVARNRLGLTMAPITGLPGAAAIPYGAVLYDGHGRPWVYVESAPLTYQRKSIKIQDVTGDQVTLSDGPAVGTRVVTRGAAELFGAEDEIGSENIEDR